VTYEDISDAEILKRVETWWRIVLVRATEYSPKFTLPDEYELFFERKGKQRESKERPHVLVDHTKRRTMVLTTSGPESKQIC
jgi:hypothetical protein